MKKPTTWTTGLAGAGVDPRWAPRGVPPGAVTSREAAEAFFKSQVPPPQKVKFVDPLPLIHPPRGTPSVFPAYPRPGGPLTGAALLAGHALKNGGDPEGPAQVAGMAKEFRLLPGGRRALADETVLIWTLGGIGVTVLSFVGRRCGLVRPPAPLVTHHHHYHPRGYREGQPPPSGTHQGRKNLSSGGEGPPRRTTGPGGDEG